MNNIEAPPYIILKLQSLNVFFRVRLSLYQTAIIIDNYKDSFDPATKTSNK